MASTEGQKPCTHTHFYCLSIKSHHMIESTLTHVNTAGTFVSPSAYHQYYYILCSKKGSHALLWQLQDWKASNSKQSDNTKLESYW